MSIPRLQLAPDGKYTLQPVILEGGIRLAINNETGEQYIAQKIPPTTFPALEETRELWDSESGVMVKNLLNHENLVSLVDIIAEPSSTGCISSINDEDGRGELSTHGRPAFAAESSETTRSTGPESTKYILWDNCDAGNLQTLIDRPEFPVRNDLSYFYPEAFVWHFVVSMLRALAYLHEGYRDHFDPSTGRRIAYQPDVDWHPVLHRAIVPSNVFFSHPRGHETYGLCKLGNFSSAFVSGHVRGHPGEKLPAGGGVVVAPSTSDWVGVENLKAYANLPGGAHYHALSHDLLKFRPYTTGSDQAAVGRLALHLMRGEPTPPPGECPMCGYWHLSTARHPRPMLSPAVAVAGSRCRIYRNLDFDVAFAGPHHSDSLELGPDRGVASDSGRPLHYSKALLSLVEDLLDRDGVSGPVGVGEGGSSSAAAYERAYTEHKRWLVESQMGRFVVDLEYEMRRRRMHLTTAGAAGA